MEPDNTKLTSEITEYKYNDGSIEKMIKFETRLTDKTIKGISGITIWVTKNYMNNNTRSRLFLYIQFKAPGLFERLIPWTIHGFKTSET